LQVQVLEGEGGMGESPSGRHEERAVEEELEHDVADAAAAAQPAGFIDKDDGQQDPATTTTKIRTSVLVPISSSNAEITPLLLQQLFSVKGVQAQALLLGLIDAHGVVTRSSLYNYIQAPLEGPGMANLELVDD